MGSILFVDDNLDTCKIMSLLIARAGHRCICAMSVAEAEEKLTEETPDLIMADFMMPYESGVDLLKMVRRNPRLGDVPFIMYSAVSERRYIDEAMAAGATDYWLKGSIHGNDFARRLVPYLPATGNVEPTWPAHRIDAV
jgi:CheY-like chemotaxis protein